MARRSVADKLESLLTHYSVSETARRLGVSRRTVQRWKAGQYEPSRDSAASIGRVETGVRRAETNTAKREGFKRPALPVDLPAHRQTIPDPRDLAKGISTKEARRVYSNTVVYDLRNASDAAIVDLFSAYQKLGPDATYRFIYEYKRDPNKTRNLQSNISFYIPAAIRARIDAGEKRVHVSHNIESLGSRSYDSRAGMLDAIGDVRRIGKLLYVVLTDPRLPTPGHGKKRPRRSR